LGAGDGDVLFVLAGRISAWKGQKLLVEAFAHLINYGHTQARLAIVGSARAGQKHFERELASFVAESSCAERITIIPFREDIASVWNASDVVVVPSTQAEPFGRVAIEAMGFGRPVIAAAHGGLIEIVAHGETGLLFAPRDPQALADAMATMVTNTTLRQLMGAAGKLRQQKLFSVSGYASRLVEIFENAENKRSYWCENSISAERQGDGTRRT
jgi:glycosyltransferase involved in cell wall biosynthesis